MKNTKEVYLTKIGINLPKYINKKNNELLLSNVLLGYKNKIKLFKKIRLLHISRNKYPNVISRNSIIVNKLKGKKISILRKKTKRYLSIKKLYNKIRKVRYWIKNKLYKIPWIYKNKRAINLKLWKTTITFKLINTKQLPHKLKTDIPTQIKIKRLKYKDYMIVIAKSVLEESSKKIRLLVLIKK